MNPSKPKEGSGRSGKPSDGAFPNDSRFFRDVLSSYPTGVCVITAESDGGEKFGLAVGSFTSISLDPPLVGFFPGKRSRSWAGIEKVGRFCVNILGAHQAELCRHFSTRFDRRFAGLEHRASPAGMPLFDGILGWIDCRIERVVEVGDHWLVVGAVEDLGPGSDESPLMFFRGGYHDLAELGDESD